MALSSCWCPSGYRANQTSINWRTAAKYGSSTRFRKAPPRRSPCFFPPPAARHRLGDSPLTCRGPSAAEHCHLSDARALPRTLTAPARIFASVIALFDRPWDELDVRSLERFLSEAGDEGLTWEAKANTVP